MVDSFQLKEPLPVTDLDPEDMHIIFDHVDDHLAFWEVLFNDSVSSQDDHPPVSPVSPIPPVSLMQLSTLADGLKMSSAPLYPSQDVGGVRGFAYRFLNLAVKIFGYPQIRFNRGQREFLGEILLVLQQVNEQTAVLNSTFDRLNDKIRALEVENNQYRHDIERLFWLLGEMRGDLDCIADARSGENRD